MIPLESVQGNQLMVIDEYDVIVMRQMVRQMARQNRANLVQQARITSAISGVARELIVQGLSVLFSILVNDDGDQLALEVRCLPQVDSRQTARLNFEHNVNIREARRLVDETIFAFSDGRPPPAQARFAGSGGGGRR